MGGEGKKRSGRATQNESQRGRRSKTGQDTPLLDGFRIDIALFEGATCDLLAQMTYQRGNGRSSAMGGDAGSIYQYGRLNRARMTTSQHGRMTHGMSQRALCIAYLLAHPVPGLTPPSKMFAVARD